MEGDVIEAKWWEEAEDDQLRCLLCPRYCLIGEGKAGFCFVRRNQDGKLYSLAYAHPSALQVDPIEKKPLSHFLPGTNILSLGTAGCNMGCRFCQNWDLSKAKLTQRAAQELSPEDAVELAIKHNCRSLAFTYNEPTIWGEYAIELSRLGRLRGLKSVMVTAGYITQQALLDVYEFIDAANIDLKSFREDFYQQYVKAELQPVLDALVTLRNDTDVWLELTTLLIPTLNDSNEELGELCRWVVDHLGPDTPLHLTAFHPDFKLNDLPRTPSATLSRARDIAQGCGLHYVYTGNVHDPAGQTTYCPKCNEAVIERDWHAVRAVRLKNGACSYCGETIAGHFSDDAAPPSNGHVKPLPI